MKTCKRRVIGRGLILSIVFCLMLLSPSVWAQQSSPPQNGNFKGLPNLLASNVSPASDEKGQEGKRPAEEKESSEKDPGSYDVPSGGGAPPTPDGAEEPPLGYAGRKTGVVKNAKVTEEQESGDFIPVDDRWRVGFPEWNRHPGVDADYPYTKGRLINPYRQNVLKGDYPVIGNDKFFMLKLVSESFFSVRRIPLPSDVSAQRPDAREFFGRAGLFLYNQNFMIAGDLFQGAASFKPVDWRIHAMVAFNFNYGYSKENGVLRVDDRLGNTRRDGHIALQEAFGEYRLGDTTKLFPFLRGRGSKGGYSPYFDTTSIRAGIQLFNSDFRGFIFNDTNLGTRLFGNFASNRYQYNVAFFKMLEKDTNSGLNTLDLGRNQEVFIANLYRQDTFKKGYTVQFSYHYNRDDGSFFNDFNGFPVRPGILGFGVPHRVRAHYIGFTSDGHFGEKLPGIFGKIGGGLNLSTAFYQVLGNDSFSGFANRRVDINGQLAAAELSVDRDWLRFRTSFFYTSGDDNPTDGTARGFDSILDDNNFAGGKFSFFNQVGIPFLNTTAQLTTPLSLIPSLRTSKLHGQANFINPGLTLYNAGLDADLTQKLRVIANVNFIRFNTTEALELAIFQPRIEKYVGTDYNVGVRYRPYLNENIVIFSGIAAFQPGEGFRSIYTSNCTPGRLQCGTEKGSKMLFNLFTTVKLTY
ncbi:MAG: hypothetical protein JNN15_07480 [Blastocatellia bacterium]|nr:hypothetical protein [Blastocatellia bacterium]